MTDLASDRVAAIELIIQEYQRLKRNNPTEPSDVKLLAYVKTIDEGGFILTDNNSLVEEFFDTYAPRDNTPTAVMLTSYLVDLMKTSDKLEGICRFPKTPR